jgi:hypothetical protein
MYGAAHIFFSNKIDPKLMDMIAGATHLMDRVVNFSEFNQDFSCKFDNLFSLDMPESL